MTKKIALITGASRGLGRAAAIALANRNVDVVGTYLSNRAEAEATAAAVAAKGGTAVMLQLDTGKVARFDGFADQVRAVLKDRFDRDRFDFLVNNAGMGIYHPIAEFPESDFDQLVNVHFKGVFFLTQKLLPLIADGGRILNFSSGLARFSMPGSSVYGALKGAVEVLSRYLAQELGPRRITVNTIAPGAIETDFGGGRVRDNQELKAHVSAATALGRPGLPDDIGGLVAVLLSDECGWVNGQRIEAAGGVHL